MTARRVAFVLPSFTGGGAERVMLNLAGAIDRDRYAPVVVVLDGTGPLSASVPADVEIVNLQTPRVRHAIGKLVRCLRRLKPHIAISTLGYLNLALLAVRPALPAGLRLAVREANSPYLRATRWPMAAYLGYRLLYPTADRVICQHGGTTAAMVRRFKVPPEQIVDLPNPVNVDAVRSAAAVPLRADGDGSRFVAAGRLTRQKGFDRLIDLATDMPPTAMITILGDGPDRDRLETRAADRGVDKQVRLAGYTDNPWAWFAGADALLLPSRWEGLPNVALESLACGTPVIASDDVEGLIDVERSAPAGAVRFAAIGDPFIAAMSAVVPQPTNPPRSSLLPANYHLPQVAARLADALSAL